MKNLLLIALAMVLLGACKTITNTTDNHSEKTESEDRHQEGYLATIDSLQSELEKRDSNYVERIPAAHSNVNIDNPCDSLTGLLKQFEINAGKTKIKSDGKTLQIESGCDEVVKSYQSENTTLKLKLSKMVNLRDSIYAAQETKESVSQSTTQQIQPWVDWRSFWWGVKVTLIVLTVAFLVYKVVKWKNS